MFIGEVWRRRPVHTFEHEYCEFKVNPLLCLQLVQASLAPIAISIHALLIRRNPVDFCVLKFYCYVYYVHIDMCILRSLLVGINDILVIQSYSLVL